MSAFSGETGHKFLAESTSHVWTPPSSQIVLKWHLNWNYPSGTSFMNPLVVHLTQTQFSNYVDHIAILFYFSTKIFLNSVLSCKFSFREWFRMLCRLWRHPWPRRRMMVKWTKEINTHKYPSESKREWNYSISGVFNRNMLNRFVTERYDQDEQMVNASSFQFQWNICT